jgi:hypothetical protein
MKFHVNEESESHKSKTQNCELFAVVESKGRTMDCRKAQSHFALWSIEESDLECCEELKQHLQQCPPCAREWNQFRQTLFVVSTATQTLPDSHCSHAMWGACLQQIMNKTEQERLAGKTAPGRDTRLTDGVIAESAGASNTSGISFWQRWFGNQPTWGWAALGGAAIVFGAVWFGAGAPNQNVSTQPAQTPLPTSYVRFERPPVGASPFINHHTAMGFDPFNDHVGTTMVSNGATDALRTGESRVPQEEAEFQAKRPADFVPLPALRDDESLRRPSAP